MRLYAPTYSALLGYWVPPAVDKVQTLAPINAQ
jgi:hypothetical protein